jgi:hypothetical protein
MEGHGWIDLAQDRYKLQAPMNMVMVVVFHKIQGIA